jgi:hypothetical protein
MRRLATRCAASLACALVASHAAAMSPDPTGLWYDPAQSGWGLTLAQQGDKAFGVLFVYDQADHPVWYVASDLVTPQTFAPVPGGPGLTGTLYRTMGPWFGGAFDPHAVTVTAVGSLSVQYADASQQALRADYVIDGTAYTRFLQPQTWVDDGGAFLAGGYAGGMRFVTKSATTCPDLQVGPFDPTRGFTFEVLVDAPGQVRLDWGTGIDTFCEATGRYTQRGQLASITGTLSCGDVNGGLRPGTGMPMELTALAITPAGFAGAAAVHQGSCTYTGHVGGVRLPR